jgi:hypothetical protein
MPWLKINEGETVTASIDLSSIKSIAKHWTGQRSELCLGEGCPHCTNGTIKRWRYQAKLIVDGVPTSWEFGEQTLIDLQQIPHDTSWAHITITRVGQGRQARNQIREASVEQPADQAPVETKYTRGKYGQFVQR